MTKGNKYAQYRWAIYGKLGAIKFAQKSLFNLRHIIIQDTTTASILRLLSDVEISLDNLHLALSEHLRQMKATGSWRKL